MNILLFIFGAALGSFINVLGVRYDPNRFIFDSKSIGGRSHCPQCSNTLRWFELVPIVSFLIQSGRCRRCRHRISFQYPLVEIAAGLVCVLVPRRVSETHIFNFSTGAGSALGGQFSIFNYIFPALWVLVFLTLLLIVLIDKRLYIIPDEANVFLGLTGVAITFLAASRGEIAHTSFIEPYAPVFGFLGNAWASHVLAALAAGALFALIVALTRGKGMGMGDVKLAIPLGLIFGWPDIIFIVALGFVIGALYGVSAIARGTKNLKSPVPFGPFLALAAAIIFFWGEGVVGGYMRLLGM